MNNLKRILCIDDEQDILDIGKMSLETVGGFETRQCSSGAEAVFEAKKYKPDLILLDVMMPQMDGPATLKMLRQDAGVADIPVIFMTAKVQPSEVAHYKTLGAIGVIAKPFDPIALPQEIRKIWNNIQEKNA